MTQRFHPLVLISQIQRSGGSMMSQLLDGHPELLVHPHELHIGSPKKWNWPDFSLKESPEEWFAFLYESKFEEFVANGYTKDGGNRFASKEVFPFHFSMEKLRSQFLHYCAESKPVQSQRQVLDAYFRAFFDAWENHEATGRERFIAGFTPRVVMYPQCIDRFFADYPDGRLICLVRDPCSWYASTVRRKRRHRDVRVAIEEWTACMQSIARVAGRDNVLVLIYEHVLRAPEASMRRLSEFIGITYDNIILTPTFLRQPILPNSSFGVEKYGINSTMIDRREALPADITRTIEGVALPVYQEFVRNYGLATAE